MSSVQPGEIVDGKGIYLGEWDPNNDGKVIDVFVEDDFLRESSCIQSLFNFRAAVGELTRRNGGRSYGNGTDAAIRAAIKDDTYKDGDLFIPALEFITGRDAAGTELRSGNNIYALLKTAPAFRTILDTLNRSFYGGRWVLSSSVAHTTAKDFSVHQVRLINESNRKSPEASGFPQVSFCSAVIPVRAFRRDSAPAPVPPG
ncbi:MAG: hypothetical protein EBX50_20970 [Chitinophagia bacterium]|nr:hypothetical protein [Chitinophagia bacterium]